MIRRDYEYEQVEFISKLLYTILFPQKSKTFNINDYKFDTKSLELKLNLMDLIKKNKFNDAEDMLFEHIAEDERENRGNGGLRGAVWFYLQLNHIDKETLEANDFSRREVLEGIQAIEQKAMNG